MTLTRYIVKLVRRLDKREFSRTVDAVSPETAALHFDGTAFDITITSAIGPAAWETLL